MVGGFSRCRTKDTSRFGNRGPERKTKMPVHAINGPVLAMWLSARVGVGSWKNVAETDTTTFRSSSLVPSPTNQICYSPVAKNETLPLPNFVQSVDSILCSRCREIQLARLRSFVAILWTCITWHTVLRLKRSSMIQRSSASPRFSTSPSTSIRRRRGRRDFSGLLACRSD